MRKLRIGLAAALLAAGTAYAQSAEHHGGAIHFIVTALPDGCSNQPYPKTKLIEGGAPPYYGLLDGVAPQGLDVNKSGELFGPLDDAGKYHFSVSIHDKANPGKDVSQDYRLTVKDCPKP
ncbi:hypothetical protein [Phenylobacterium montanum]|uniref:Uncharacterized protein n=1 Tax=Phenylobacterium montanum TaxID=2823693 RepID=A0A975G3M4_9CAUL|nr:hypothetical protein [Caulobacter sp. S6]QUD89396.1 hypothetical protein KCG34_05815 [Caulobacter sp. S6]